MRIIERYLMRQILQHFAVALTTVVGIFLVADFFNQIDNVVDHKATVGQAALYFLARIPLEQFVPVSVLLAVLAAFGLMNKHNEMTALRSCGASLLGLTRPVLKVGLGFTVLMLLVAEVVTPVLRGAANRMWLQEVKGVKVSAQEKDIWLRGPHSIVHIRYFDPARRSIGGVTVNLFDERFQLVRRLDAREGVFQDGRWLLRDLMEQVRDDAQGGFRVVLHAEKAEDLGLAPDDLQQVAKSSEEMSFWDLWAYVRRIEAEGYNATVYRVDLHAKATFPLVCLILCLCGPGIAARRGRRDNLAVVMVYGILTAFGFWVLQSLCLSMGYGGMLPPPVAAWVPVLVFGSLGSLILLTAD
jgi:lipopolysaccharide export system permease protein